VPRLEGPRSRGSQSGGDASIAALRLAPSAGLPALQSHRPATPRAFYGLQKVLERAAIEGVVILEFPTFDEAKAWYDSAPREPRFKGCRFSRPHSRRRVTVPA